MADAVAIGLRSLAFLATLQAAGIPIFIWLFGTSLDRSAKAVRTLAAAAAVAALVLTCVWRIPNLSHRSSENCSLVAAGEIVTMTRCATSPFS